VEQLLEAPEGLELGGDLREVTIMMSDICGFTSSGGAPPPPQVVSLLNRYFEAHDGISSLSMRAPLMSFSGMPFLLYLARQSDRTMIPSARCAAR